MMKATKTDRDIYDGGIRKRRREEVPTNRPKNQRIAYHSDIANFDVKRVLVSTGSATNVLSWEAFEALKMPIDRLKIINTPLQGFGGGTVIPKGVIDLPVVSQSYWGNTLTV
ncbi:Uncharacterized protein Adt_35307 [Abeliophyllum distichum]|uniref:Uncharacterized protein n=1 Tax=Abeliophyllum distichum TaxID=126358 RepID=A0ABD1QEL0_9LAMI